ncbi:complement C1q tumor necrosis factor-related protein 3-like [Dreissena polymorpha]|uniref:complement C1q tumor necrosis factor-related protein 3-like n=1 Tax=Dreissena polymorpha TaxID=45954 RepID=UPI0022642B97|nr:complement C1q tumor necrosis factor-related protein 3-like [Dreissena polymorpha]
MKEKSAIPQVRFHARLSDGHRSYTTNQDVVYSTVLINDGGGYSPTTGHFTAPVAGVYMFTVQYCPYSNKYAYLEIVHAGRDLQRSMHNGQEGATSVCVSMQAFTKVAMGDKVWVRAISSSEIYHFGSSRWNSFAGLLISL